jgi:DNA/RNA endonuclease YhcR with UshA esterase domain
MFKLFELEQKGEKKEIQENLARKLCVKGVKGLIISDNQLTLARSAFASNSTNSQKIVALKSTLNTINNENSFTQKCNL